MVNSSLTVDGLLQAGFEEVGCWELNSVRDLTHRIDLPTQAGVYAFAIDGVVQYVGLASKSLRQRLGFYRKPGVSQRTNVRLNEIIRGHLHEGTVVQILIAHPPDQNWNGFIIKGAEGLEAGLIATFDLPWNMRGSLSRRVVPSNSAEGGSAFGVRQSGRAARILELINETPGLTGGELARAIYGADGTQPQVNTLLRQLINEGRIERRGSGRSDPYRYFRRG